MKCENCGHLLNGGYEYPEPYCELGISDDSNNILRAFATAYGCDLTRHQRIELCREKERIYDERLCGGNMKKITNAEYMINLLLYLLHENGIKLHDFDTDEGGASLEAMIHYHIECPYRASDKRGTCKKEKTYSPTREQCFECKYDWLTNEVDG